MADCLSPSDDFFTDAPLPHEMDGWRAEWGVRTAMLERWAGHVVDCVNGHLVWRLRNAGRLDAGRVFYDGDYSDVLAPDDPRILVPRVECVAPPAAPRLQWDE